MELIQQLEKVLPPIIPIKLRNEADYYGISHMIADELKLDKVPRSFAYWTHGWIYAEPITSSKEINCWAKPKDTVLVATQQEVNILKREGYHKAHAVGMPFIYTKDAEVNRNTRSLLIMPAHSGSQSSIEADETGYIEKILELKPFFSEIVACIHSSCVVNNHWIPSLEKHGIPWILGASVFDRNSLQKMRTIFQSFDYVTTNTIGSHIPYASYCGCKVFIYNYSRFTLASYERDPWYQKNPDLLWKQYEMCDEAVLIQRFPQFFKSPIDATNNQEWANQALGEEYRQSPEAVAKLLGWHWQDQVLGYLKYYADYILDADRRQTLIKNLHSKIKPDPKYDGFELDIISGNSTNKSV
jgi:hypothetical protein